MLNLVNKVFHKAADNINIALLKSESRNENNLKLKMFFMTLLPVPAYQPKQNIKLKLLSS
jgi:hypothetical protein